MANGHYTIYRYGEEIEAGYNVADICNRPDCNIEIDRGMAYLCGAVPGGDEYGCGGYFCGEHLLVGSPPQCERCRACAEANAGGTKP